MSCLICFEMKNTIYGKKTQLFFFYSNKSTRWYRNTEIVSIERLEARDYFWWSSRSYCRLAPLECPKLPSIRILDSNIWNFYEAFVPRSFFLHQIANHNIDDFEPAFKKSKKEKLFFKIQIIVCMFSILWIQYVFLKRLIIKLPCICSVPER